MKKYYRFIQIICIMLAVLLVCKYIDRNIYTFKNIYLDMNGYTSVLGFQYDSKMQKEDVIKQIDFYIDKGDYILCDGYSVHFCGHPNETNGEYVQFVSIDSDKYKFGSKKIGVGCSYEELCNTYSGKSYYNSNCCFLDGDCLITALLNNENGDIVVDEIQISDVSSHYAYSGAY